MADSEGVEHPARRYVAGRDLDGPRFVVDEPFPWIVDEQDRRQRRALVWGADNVVAVPNEGAVPDLQGHFPGPGGWRVVVADVPPGYGVGPQGSHSPAVAVSGDEALSTPGAMHATPTVDVVVVAAGEIVLTLEGGEQRTLRPGDAVVQNGMTHAWSNPSDSTARLVTFVSGATSERQGD